MSLFDGKRLSPSVFKIDRRRVRAGHYTDQYFNHAARVLGVLAREGYRFSGEARRLDVPASALSRVRVGNIHVEMQIFARREPETIVCGTDYAIALLHTCAGHTTAAGRFVSTGSKLEIDSVHDGERAEPWVPVMKVRGRYRDFAHLETVVLGVLSRGSRVATNVYRTVKAAHGKPVFFFPARYDLLHNQPLDGYAYVIGVGRYNFETRGESPVLFSTDAQGEWLKRPGGGTAPHAYVLAFLGDTAEAMLQFARVLDPEVKRIALVDTNNDCVGDSVATGKAFFGRYRELTDAGRATEAGRYVLFAVRLDTAGNLRDVSVPASDDPECGPGVCPRLVRNVRRALDDLGDEIDVPDAWRSRARDYFRNVKIVASGGFDTERVAAFESASVPADLYGIGTSFLRGDVNEFTADIVRVKVRGRWHEMAKVGRKPIDNPRLRPVPPA